MRMTGYCWANLRATEAPVPGPTPAIMAGGEGQVDILGLGVGVWVAAVVYGRVWDRMEERRDGGRMQVL